MQLRPVLCKVHTKVVALLYEHGAAHVPFRHASVSAMLPAQELHGPCEGYLCIKQAWPSTIRTIYGDQERFETTYFAPFKARISGHRSCQPRGLRLMIDCLSSLTQGTLSVLSEARKDV